MDCGLLLHHIWTRLALYLYYFSLKNKLFKKGPTNQCSSSTSPPSLSISPLLFLFLISHLISSDLQQGGQEEELILLLFLHYPLMNFSSTAH